MPCSPNRGVVQSSQGIICDYNVNLDELFEVITGKREKTGPFDAERLFMGMPYYLETKLESEEALSVLREIEADPEMTQRALSLRLGLSLGEINFLINEKRSKFGKSSR